MRNLIILFSILIVFSSCTKDEVYSPKINFPYSPNQETIIDIEVVGLEYVTLETYDMLLELNADYYNRYGIAFNLIGESRQDLDNVYLYENRIFLPQHAPTKKITVYVIPEEYLYFEAYGYSVLQSNSVIIREDAQTSRTLAHEIGHILGLDHVNILNNVMRPYKIAKQYDTPNDFMEAQIDTMKTNIKLKF